MVIVPVVVKVIVPVVVVVIVPVVVKVIVPVVVKVVVPVVVKVVVPVVVVVVVPVVVPVVVKVVVPVVGVIPTIVVVIGRVGFHLQHLAAAGVHLVLVLDAIQHEGDFVVAVVQIIVPLDKLQVAAAQLGGQQLLGCLGVDVPFRRVGVVPVVRIQRHRAGTDAVPLNRCADCLLHLGQESGVRLGRPLL